MASSRMVELLVVVMTCGQQQQQQQQQQQRTCRDIQRSEQKLDGQ
jgi:hypothetical protein